MATTHYAEARSRRPTLGLDPVIAIGAAPPEVTVRSNPDHESVRLAIGPAAFYFAPTDATEATQYVAWADDLLAQMGGFREAMRTIGSRMGSARAIGNGAGSEYGIEADRG